MEVNHVCEKHGTTFKVVCGEEVCGGCWADEFLGPEPARRQRPKVKVEAKMRHHRVSRH
jgi:hypothetical protein